MYQRNANESTAATDQPQTSSPATAAASLPRRCGARCTKGGCSGSCNSSTDHTVKGERHWCSGDTQHLPHSFSL